MTNSLVNAFIPQVPNRCKAFSTSTRIRSASDTQLTALALQASLSGGGFRNVAGVQQHSIRRSLCESSFVFFHATSFEETCLQKRLENHGIISRNTTAKESQVLNVIQKPQGDKRLSQQQSTLPHVRVQSAALSLLGNLLVSLTSHSGNIFKPLHSVGTFSEIAVNPREDLTLFWFRHPFILLANASRMLRVGHLSLESDDLYPLLPPDGLLSWSDSLFGSVSPGHS